MTFKEALNKLGIPEYEERIFKSNSHGELFHLNDYILIATTFEDTSWFRGFFDIVVKDAESRWERPESVFQHITKILSDSLR